MLQNKYLKTEADWHSCFKITRFILHFISPLGLEQDGGSCGRSGASDALFFYGYIDLDVAFGMVLLNLIGKLYFIYNCQFKLCAFFKV